MSIVEREEIVTQLKKKEAILKLISDLPKR